MSRFDEEPDAPIHSECAAEIARLQAENVRLDTQLKTCRDLRIIDNKKIDRLTAERDALHESLCKWVDANAPGGWIDDLRNSNEARAALAARVMK